MKVTFQRPPWHSALEPPQEPYWHVTPLALHVAPSVGTCAGHAAAGGTAQPQAYSFPGGGRTPLHTWRQVQTFSP